MSGELKSLIEMSEKDYKTQTGHPIVTREFLIRNYNLLDDEGNIKWDELDNVREAFPICYHEDADMISFKMMTKPVKEGGKGAQWSDLVSVALEIVDYLDKKFPCEENKHIMANLQRALHYDQQRTIRRLKAGVEGENKEES